VCSWNESEGYYDCVSGITTPIAAPADAGAYPLECQ
jgi:hypothetical protein